MACFTDNLSTFFLKENRWNAVASPTFTADGLELYFGVRQHRIRGWTGNRPFNDFGTIAVDGLPENPDIPRERKLETEGRNRCDCGTVYD